jgi:hypothetical protein
MLYEMGTEEIKNELVNSLVDSLSGKKKNVVQNSQDLLLFPEKSNLDKNGPTVSYPTNVFNLSHPIKN